MRESVVGDSFDIDTEEGMRCGAHIAREVNRKCSLGKRIPQHCDRGRNGHAWDSQNLLPLREGDPTRNARDRPWTDHPLAVLKCRS